MQLSIARIILGGIRTGGENLPGLGTRVRRAGRDKLFQDLTEPIVFTGLVEKIIGTDLHATAAILRGSIVAEDQNCDARSGGSPAQGFEDVETVTFPELKVQHDRVTCFGLQRRDGVRFRLRVAYHLYMLERGDGFGETLPNDR